MISRYLQSTKKASGYGTLNGIFWGGFTGAFGNYNQYFSTVSSVGNISGYNYSANTPRMELRGCSYGKDKGVFGTGVGAGITPKYTFNLVTNTGTIGSDQYVSSSQTPGYSSAGVTYGSDKALFCPGYEGWYYYYVSNTGTLTLNSLPVGVTGRREQSACSYGEDKGVFAFGYGQGSTYTLLTILNLITNTGTIGTDSSFSATARAYVAGISYGKTKGVFAFGNSDKSGWMGTSYTIVNYFSDVGVMASDSTVGLSGRASNAVAPYGMDKAVNGYCGADNITETTRYNLISNVGVFAADATASDYSRRGAGGAGYGA